jgi:hypothetical protein
MSLRSSHLRGGRFFSFGRVSTTVLLAAALHSWCFAQEGTTPAPATTAEGKSARQAVVAKDEPSISEEQLKQQLAGKMMYLRSGYLDNSLHFNDLGQFLGTSPKAAYTLSLIQIEKVHLTRNKLELQGARYGLHFLGEGPTEDALANADKVRITPKKKIVTITIERAHVEKPKKVKTSKHGKGGTPQTPATAGLSTEGATGNMPPVNGELSQKRANQQLQTAIQAVFAPGLDERMVATLPDFWRLYFQAIAAKSDFRPRDAAVLRQSAVDRKARLLSTFEPPSNDFAQNAGVVGIAQYHVVVGPDGKAEEIAVGRPIGFGLDENAVDSIRKASFEPAMKDGKPVPVMLDLLVQFRIYSKRTASNGGTETSSAATQEAPVLPGPYSVNKPAAEAPKQP